MYSTPLASLQLASLPQTLVSHPSFANTTTSTAKPIPDSVPILKSSSDLPRTAHLPSYPQVEDILSLMAQPNDSERYILDALEKLKEEGLCLYQYPYYGSLLEAALRFIRPATLQFILSNGLSIQEEAYLDTLSEEQLSNTLKTLAEIWAKHHYSRGRRDFDRPAVGFPVVKKMTEIVASLYTIKMSGKAIVDLFDKDFKAKLANKSFLDAIRPLA